MSNMKPIPSFIAVEKERFLLGEDYILDIPVNLLSNNSFKEYINLYSEASKQNSELTRLTGVIMNLSSDLYISINFESDKRAEKKSLFNTLDVQFETVLETFNVLRYKMNDLYKVFNNEEKEFINRYMTI